MTFISCAVKQSAESTAEKDDEGANGRRAEVMSMKKGTAADAKCGKGERIEATYSEPASSSEST